ncbi:MAG: DUF4190 domain-containing protein [Myxococcales bacterium]|jgi:hypothetical protein|nr:DUF4190 domain-containing protein [Myxococcales bacterium]
MQPAPAAKTDTKATVALSLGILAVTCAGPLAGIPAFVIGAVAHRDADRSRGAIRGGGMAVAAMILGVLGTAMTVAAGVAIAVVSLHRPTLLAEPNHPVIPRVSYTDSPGPLSEPGRASPSTGAIETVELGRGDLRTLRGQLKAADERAKKRDKQMLVFLTTKKCGPCREFESGLIDPRMQKAFLGTVLVKVDVEEFRTELEHFRMDVDTVPWFFRLDDRLRAVDAISAAEWEDNVPGNMAPVFESFFAGTYGKRKLPPPLGTTL